MQSAAPHHAETRTRDLSRRIAVICPVLDDWESFAQLAHALAAVATRVGIVFDIIAVDDGSSERWQWDRLGAPPEKGLASLEVIRLALNLGHQRAIAIGLVEVSERGAADGILVMDSDGEDRPDDAWRLIEHATSRPGTIVFAERAVRSESRSFKLGYGVYKALFRLMTGRRISFGNFSFIPAAAARRLCLMPELWNNLPATIMRSRLRWTQVPTSRGQRYAGASKMALVSLVTHGLSAMSVYSDVIFVRLLIAASAIGALGLLGIVIAVVLRLATNLSIPGWTTNVVGFIVTMLMQTGALVIIAALQILAGRSSRPIVPRTDCRGFIEDRECRVFAPELG